MTAIVECVIYWISMMTSTHGNTFHITKPLWVESIGHWWIPNKRCQQCSAQLENVLILTLTHWGRVTHICVGKATIIGSENGLSPGRRQAIIWTNAGKLLVATLGTNFNEILIECYSFSFKKMHIKISSGKWRPSCLCFNVLPWC